MNGSFHIAIILRVLLCVVLALAGVQGALACVARGPVAMVELCGGGAVRHLWLDAEGRPVEAPLPAGCDTCPKCLTPQGLAALPDPAVPVARVLTWTKVQPTAVVPALPVAEIPQRSARGPPRLG